LGATVAYRRSNTTLTNYIAGSNNNLFYAGTPGASNLIYSDGTNADQSIGAYRSRVSPIDNASGTENTVFLSTSGSSANFLHVNGTIASYTESTGANIASFTD